MGDIEKLDLYEILDIPPDSQEKEVRLRRPRRRLGGRGPFEMGGGRREATMSIVMSDNRVLGHSYVTAF